MADTQSIVLSNEDPEDQFILQDLIGEGAYGTVYKAIHRASGKTVSIKIVPSQGDIQNLQKEIQILKECKSDYIVKYYGSFFKDDNLWLIMEYCIAGSVIDLLKITKKQLYENEISAILSYALRGIEYLHQNKKIHRDIKAGNILLDHRGQAKLADFGVSAQLLHTNADKETKIGTPFWMSPEVISKHKYNSLTDIWSLGITAIELAEGQPPLSHMHPVRAMFVIKSNPPQGLTEPQKWSHDFNDFVSSCLKINVDERPSATQLLQHRFIQLSQNEGWRLKKLVEESIVPIESYRQNRSQKQEEANDNNPQTMISVQQQDDSIGNSVGTIVDIGTLVIKKDEEEQTKKEGADLDFVAYAKGMRMVEEMSKEAKTPPQQQLNQVQKQQPKITNNNNNKNEFDSYANEDENYDDEEEEESDLDNSDEVLDKMTLEEQERFRTFLFNKMEVEITKIKEKYMPKIRELDARIEKKKPKPQLHQQKKIEPKQESKPPSRPNGAPSQQEELKPKQNLTPISQTPKQQQYQQIQSNHANDEQRPLQPQSQNNSQQKNEQNSHQQQKPDQLISGPKRLEQNLQQIINLPFNFQVNQDLLQKLTQIKFSQVDIQNSTQIKTNPKPKLPFEFAPSNKR